MSSELQYLMRESSSVASRLSKSDERVCSSIQLTECQSKISIEKDSKPSSRSFTRRISKTKLYRDIAPLWLRRRLQRRQQNKKEKANDVREIREEDVALIECGGLGNDEMQKESPKNRGRNNRVTGVDDTYAPLDEEDTGKTSDFRQQKHVGVQTEAETLTMISPSFHLDDTYCKETEGRTLSWDRRLEKNDVFTFDHRAAEEKLQSPQRNHTSHFILGSVSSQGSMWESASEEMEECRRCHVEDPRGVCVDDNDNILLVDRARNRISLFTPSGHFLRHVLTEHDGLHQPKALCVLHDGSLAVTDSSNIVKIFHFSE